MRGRSITGFVLACLVAAKASAGSLELTVSGALDPDSGDITRVDDRGSSDAIEFGAISSGVGAEQGRLVVARDGSGTYLVATLEVEVRRSTASLSPRRALSQPAARALEVMLRVADVPPGAEVRYAPGTGADWGASGRVGTPLGPHPQVIFTAPPTGGVWLHQVALFMPSAPSSTVQATTTYSARSASGRPSASPILALPVRSD